MVGALTTHAQDAIKNPTDTDIKKEFLSAVVHNKLPLTPYIPINGDDNRPYDSCLAYDLSVQ